MTVCQYKNLACHLFYFCAFSICFVLVTGCGSKSNETGQAQSDEGEPIASEEVLGSLRSSRVTDLVHFSDSAFDKGLLNEVDRANRYLKSNNKGAAAVNLGIYLSDLSSLVEHGKRDEASRYYQACLSLAEFIGMKKQFSEAVQLHFNDIIAGDETLKKSVNNQFKDATNTADHDDVQKLHAAALAGYYIEELYLLASFIKSRQANQDSIFFATLGVFASQKNELENLISYFDHVQLKSSGISVYQELLTLQEKYLIMDTERFWLLLKTNPNTILQDESLQNVFTSLSTVRQHIVDYN